MTRHLASLAPAKIFLTLAASVATLSEAAAPAELVDAATSPVHELVT